MPQIGDSMVDTYIRMKRAEIDIVKEIMAVHTGNAEFRNLKIDVACEKPALHASISYLDGDNLMMFADAIANNIFVFWISKGNDFYTSGFPMHQAYIIEYQRLFILKGTSCIMTIKRSRKENVRRLHSVAFAYGLVPPFSVFL